MRVARFILWLAGRDLRAQPEGFRLYALALALGVGAMVAVTSFRDGLSVAVDEQAQALLGADLSVRARHPFSAAAEQRLRELPGEHAREVNFRTMVFFPDHGATRFVQVRALEAAYPFYGKLDTVPAEAAHRMDEGPFALVEENVLIQAGAAVGDTLKVGGQLFTVAGRLQRAPGETPAEAFIAPRIYIPLRYAEATGLLLPGAIATYRLHVRLPDRREAPALARQLKLELSGDRVEVDTAESRKRALLGSANQMARYLNLVGFAALILGCAGTAGAVQSYVQRRLDAVAVLRCLGAPAWAGLLVVLLQVLVLALVGVGLGALLAAGAQVALAGALREVLPVAVPPQLSGRALAQGALAGVLSTLAFAALPLLALRQVPPMRALGLRAAPEARRRDFAPWLIRGAVALLVIGYAGWQTGSFLRGLGIAAGFGLAAAALAGLARGLRGCARAVVGRLGSAAWRQGVASLYRPGNQTTLLIATLGLGVFLVAVLQIGERALLHKLSVYRSPEQSTLVLIDLQQDQRDAVAALVQTNGLPVQHITPIVTMRLTAVNGRGAADLMNDPASGIPAWVLQREYRSTYRGALTPSETLLEGRWQGRWPAGKAGRVPVSVEDDMRGHLRLKLGDRLSWDVQGRPVETEVASVRLADWQSMRPNFYVVFPQGVLEDAPQTHALFTRVTNATASARLQREVALQFPNVSAIDLALILATVNDILGSIAAAVRYLALFAVGAGFLVLAGAVRAHRFARLRELVLLRTLGAPRRYVMTVALAEYALLGGLAGLGGVALAAAAGWPLCHFVLKTPLVLEPVPLLGLAAGCAALTVLLGLLSTRRPLRAAPLEVLRSAES